VTKRLSICTVLKYLPSLCLQKQKPPYIIPFVRLLVVAFHYRRIHGRKSRGDGGGRIPPEFAVGGRLYRLSPPPDFCRFSKFQALAMDSSPPPRFQPRFTPLGEFIDLYLGRLIVTLHCRSESSRSNNVSRCTLTTQLINEFILI
jgi:hypothetical protein